MRLAHFIQRYPPALGGSEAYFARLSQYCVDQGDDVSVFTSNAMDLTAFWSPQGKCLAPGDTVNAGVKVRRYPLWRMRGRRWLLKPLSLVPNRIWQCLTLPCNPISFRMWRDAGEPRPVRYRLRPFDAVHASAFPYAFPIACAHRLARRLNVPFFITPFLHAGDPHDPHDRIRRSYTTPALTWLLHQADGIFVQTPTERSLALALGLPLEKVILQGLGIEPRECTGGDRTAARRRWNLPDDAFVLGHLANLSWEKGTNDLVQASRALWREGRPIYLLLAGPQMPNFTRIWKGHPNAQLLGAISDEDKRDFYAAIDTFVLPSRSDSFGLVLLEAWANGVPNLGYRAGGIADVIRHQSDGLLVKCGDIAALAGAIRRLHDDIDMRVRLGVDGHARLPIDFRWDDKLALVRQAIMQRMQPLKPQNAVHCPPGVINSSE